MNALKVAYLANILILIPVAIPTLLRTLDVAEGKFAESEGFRVLVGSLWTAILLWTKRNTRSRTARKFWLVGGDG